MDNNVQNIRSGRALAGFGKFFSGLGLVIAAIGAILGGAVPVIVAGVVILLIGGQWEAHDPPRPPSRDSGTPGCWKAPDC